MKDHDVKTFSGSDLQLYVNNCNLYTYLTPITFDKYIFMASAFADSQRTYKY